MFEKYLNAVQNEQLRVEQIYESIFGESNLMISEGWKGASAVVGGLGGAALGNAVSGGNHIAALGGALAGSAAGAAITADEGKSGKAAKRTAQQGAITGLKGAAIGAGIGAIGGAVLGGSAGNAIAQGSSAQGAATVGGAGLGAVGGAITGGLAGATIGTLVGGYKGAESTNSKNRRRSKKIDDDIDDDIDDNDVDEDSNSLDEGLKKALIGGVVGSILGAGLGYASGGRYGEQIGNEITDQIDASGQRMADNTGQYIDDATNKLNGRIDNFADATKNAGTELIQKTAGSTGEFVQNTLHDVGQDGSQTLHNIMVGTPQNPGLAQNLRQDARAIGVNVGQQARQQVMKGAQSATDRLADGNYAWYDLSKFKDSAAHTAYSYAADGTERAVQGGVEHVVGSVVPDKLEFVANNAGKNLKSMTDTYGAKIASGVKTLGAEGAKHFRDAIDKGSAAAQTEVAAFGTDMKKDTQNLLRGAYSDVKPIVKNTTAKLGKLTGAGIGASAGGLIGTLAGASMPNKKDNKKKQRKQNA